MLAASDHRERRKSFKGSINLLRIEIPIARGSLIKLFRLMGALIMAFKKKTLSPPERERAAYSIKDGIGNKR